MKQNFVFSGYNKKGHLIESFIIEDRTEHEANKEAMHYVEAHQIIDDWSLTPSPEPSKDDKLRDESLKWWVNLGHEMAADLRDKYYPERVLLTADERLEIYKAEHEPKAKDMQEGFTGGEWICSPVMNFSDTLVSYIRTKDKEVAQLRGCVTGEEKEAEANARLIAAAPAMYEALKEIVLWMKVKDGRMEFKGSEQKAHELKAILNRINQK